MILQTLLPPQHMLLLMVANNSLFGERGGCLVHTKEFKAHDYLMTAPYNCETLSQFSYNSSSQSPRGPGSTIKTSTPLYTSMARGSHGNFDATGLRTRNSKVHFTRFVEGTDSSVDGEMYGPIISKGRPDPLDFLSSIRPSPRTIPVFTGPEPATLLFWLSVLSLFFTGFLAGSTYDSSTRYTDCSWLSALRHPSEFFSCTNLDLRYRLPLPACGYNATHFGILTNSSAEILAFPINFMHEVDTILSKELDTYSLEEYKFQYDSEPVTSYSLEEYKRHHAKTVYNELRQKILLREKELTAFWSAKPSSKLGLTNAQVEWILNRLQYAEKELQTVVTTSENTRNSYWQWAMSKIGLHKAPVREYSIETPLLVNKSGYPLKTTPVALGPGLGAKNAKRATVKTITKIGSG